MVNYSFFLFFFFFFFFLAEDPELGASSCRGDRYGTDEIRENGLVAKLASQWAAQWNIISATYRRR